MYMYRSRIRDVDQLKSRSIDEWEHFHHGRSYGHMVTWLFYASKCWLNTIVHTVIVLICYVENRYIGFGINSAVFERNLLSWFAGKSIKLLPSDVMFKAEMHHRSPDPLAGFNGSYF